MFRPQEKLIIYQMAPWFSFGWQFYELSVKGANIALQVLNAWKMETQIQYIKIYWT